MVQLSSWIATLTLLAVATVSACGWVHSTTWRKEGGRQTSGGGIHQRSFMRLSSAAASTTRAEGGAGEMMEVWCSFNDTGDDASSQVALCDAIVVNSSHGDEQNLKNQQKNQPVYLVESSPDNNNDDGSDRPYYYEKIKYGNDIVGIKVDITNESGQQKALEAIGSVPWILAYATTKNSNNKEESSDSNNNRHNSDDGSSSPWLMIPAENLVGAASQTGTKIAFVVERAQDVMGLSNALEIGVDAICLDSSSCANIEDVWEAVWQAKEQRRKTTTKKSSSNQQQQQQGTTTTTPKVVEGSCWRMPLVNTNQKGGSSTSSSSVIADRVCIDFVRNLSSTEGCWIGSSAKIMALVLSEAATSSFVPSRPFRVNAGPVHSYVCLAPDGDKTKYLCELQPGDEVLVYDSATATSRAVAVGRLKIEVRPCVLVGLGQQRQQEEEDEEERKGGDVDQHQEPPPARVLMKGQIFLQQAETVRLGQEGGDYVRVTDLPVLTSSSVAEKEEEEADKLQPLLLRVTSAGTHVGGRYTGKVDEK